MLVTIAAATSVQQDPLSHVHLTRPLGLDFGNGHFARQGAVAARVGFNDIVKCVCFASSELLCCVDVQNLID